MARFETTTWPVTARRRLIPATDLPITGMVAQDCAVGVQCLPRAPTEDSQLDRARSATGIESQTEPGKLLEEEQ